MRRPASFLALALSLSLASVAAADPIDLGDVAGRYAFWTGREEALVGMQDEFATLGTLEIEPDGSVTGTRTVTRFLSQENRGLPRFVSQSAVGSCTVGPDGMGTITLTWSPPLTPLWVNGGTFPEASTCSLLHHDPVERIDFTLHREGFYLVNHHSATYIRDCPPPWTDGNQYRPGASVAACHGEAARQGSPCPTPSAASPVFRSR